MGLGFVPLSTDFSVDTLDQLLVAVTVAPTTVSSVARPLGLN